MSPEHREVNRRLRILEHAKETGNVCLTCRYFGIGRTTFYRWKKKYDQDGRDGLVPGKPIGKKFPNQLPGEVVEKILHLRTKYHLGQLTERPHSLHPDDKTPMEIYTQRMAA